MIMSGNMSCILVVGSTGTGKSTLIGHCTGAPVNTSGGTSECTLDIQAFNVKGNESGPVWIDSVGFDGTDCSRSDEEAFQYILRFLQENNISHVVGIIWTVNPDEREAAKLQEQAKLINKFQEGTVWNNVVLVVKKSRGNARKDGAGALAAANRYCSNADNLMAVGYALLEQLDDNEKTFWKTQTQENRLKMGIMKEEEAKEKIKDTMKKLPPLFQVVFCNSKCVDCGVISDPRLLPLACHTLKEEVHPQENVPFHRGQQSAVHPAHGVANRHTGPVAYRKERHGGHKILGNRRYKEIPYMSCCSADPSHPGCQVYHPCCQQPQGAQGCKAVFSCCGTEVAEGNPGCARQFPCCNLEEGAKGCQDQCSYCKVAWGQFNKDCIGRKHHNVISI